MDEIPGQSALILGYGTEGQSVHRHLRAHRPHVKIGIADRNRVDPLPDSSVEMHTRHEYLKSIPSYQVIIRSPGISPYLAELQQAQQEGRWITSATNIFFSECPGMVIGVTGTKGKSTTATLIAEIVKQQYPDVRLVGNIGHPALDHLAGANRQTIFVAELSSHQLLDSRYSPHIAVVLNIMPEHLDYFTDFDQYVGAKSQIVLRQTQEDIVIFNPVHNVTARIAEAAKSQKYHFSLTSTADPLCWMDRGVIYAQRSITEGEVILSAKDIPLLGMGNLENTLAAVCVGLILEIPNEKIRKAVEEFKPLEHRLESIGEFRGIRFYNDSLATIPEATINALETFRDEATTLIAGGFDRGLDYQALGPALAHSSIQNLILFPDTGAKIAAALKEADPQSKIKIIKVASMEEAVRTAYELTPSGSVCLMSPASASFNLFRNYADRGNAFKKWVRKLGSESA